MFNLISAYITPYLTMIKYGCYVVAGLAIAALYWRVSYLKDANDALTKDNVAYKNAQTETLATIEKMKHQREVDMWAVQETIMRDRDAMKRQQAMLDALAKEQDAPTAAVLKKTIQMLGENHATTN